jgi:hypothetical protein
MLVGTSMLDTINAVAFKRTIVIRQADSCSLCNVNAQVSIAARFDCQGHIDLGLVQFRQILVGLSHRNSISLDGKVLQISTVSPVPHYSRHLKILAGDCRNAFASRNPMTLSGFSMHAR